MPAITSRFRLDMTYSWGKPEEVVAQRFLKNQIPGTFKKELTVNDGELCLVEKEGKLINEFGPGKHTLSSIVKRKSFPGRN